MGWQEGAEERVYSVNCPVCPRHSPPLPTLEHVERWLVDHYRTHHPEHLEEVREMILEGLPVRYGVEPEWLRTWTPEAQAQALSEWEQEQAG